MFSTVNSARSTEFVVRQIRAHSLMFGLLIAGAVILAGCAGQDFARDDAIASLQTTGVSAVEATCMADTLAAVQQLDAADPRQPRTDERRAAFVAATARCVGTEVLSVTSEQPTVVEPALAGERSNQAQAELQDAEVSIGADVTDVAAVSDEQARLQAIAALVSQGRSSENATCIVDQLEVLSAEYLYGDPNLGLGLDPLEASATASCI